MIHADHTEHIFGTPVPPRKSRGNGGQAGARALTGLHEIVEGDTAWMRHANCRGCDPELFFPVRGDRINEACEVCAGCVVRIPCLDYAMVNNMQHGIWGGYSTRERRRIRRELAIAERQQ